MMAERAKQSRCVPVRAHLDDCVELAEVWSTWRLESPVPGPVTYTSVEVVLNEHAEPVPMNLMRTDQGGYLFPSGPLAARHLPDELEGVLRLPVAAVTSRVPDDLAAGLAEAGLDVEVLEPGIVLRCAEFVAAAAHGPMRRSRVHVAVEQLGQTAHTTGGGAR